MIIQKIMKDKKITKTQVAKDLDVSNPMVTLLIQNKRSFSVKLIKRIKEKYKISYNKIMEML